MAKQPSERYRPGNIPETLPGLIQFLYDEFPRIAQALNEFPVGVNVTGTEPAVPIGTTPVEFRLFEGQPFELDLPGGGWDEALGEFTIPVSGLYQINANVVIGAFGAGQFDYGALLRLYVNNVVRWSNSAAGQDDFSLSCSLAISGFLTREDILRWTVELTHQQQTGTVPVVSTVGVTSTAQQ